MYARARALKCWIVHFLANGKEARKDMKSVSKEACKHGCKKDQRDIEAREERLPIVSNLFVSLSKASTLVEIKNKLFKESGRHMQLS